MFVANASWSQEALLRQVRSFVLPAIEKAADQSLDRQAATGFPKKGVHFLLASPRRITGNSASRTICQIAVSLSVAGEHASLPIAFRLYLS